jgi:cell division inhibitor SepF
MSLIDKITKAFNLDNDDYDYDEDYDADDDYEEEEPKPAKVRRFSSVEKDNEDIVETKPAKTRSNVLSYNPKKKNADGKPAVCVFKPVNFEEGREVVDTLLVKNIVVLNLEGLDFETAQRIVDFACGACYSIDGTLKKITNFIFVIAPHNVGVAGDFPELLAESGIKL